MPLGYGELEVPSKQGMIAANGELDIPSKEGMIAANLIAKKAIEPDLGQSPQPPLHQQEEHRQAFSKQGGAGNPEEL